MASFNHISVYKSLVKSMGASRIKIADYISKEQFFTFNNDVRYRVDHDKESDMGLEMFLNVNPENLTAIFAGYEYNTAGNLMEDRIEYAESVRDYLREIDPNCLIGEGKRMSARERLESIKNKFGEDTTLFIDYMKYYLQYSSSVDINKVRTNCMVIPNMFSRLLNMPAIATKEKSYCIADVEYNSLLIPGLMYYVLSGSSTMQAHAFTYICPPKGCEDYLLLEAVQDSKEFTIKIVNRREMGSKLSETWENISWYKNHIKNCPDVADEIRESIWNDQSIKLYDDVDSDEMILIDHPIPMIKVYKVFQDDFDLEDYEMFFDLWFDDAVSSVEIDKSDRQLRTNISKEMKKSISRATNNFINEYDTYVGS